MPAMPPVPLQDAAEGAAANLFRSVCVNCKGRGPAPRAAIAMPLHCAARPVTSCPATGGPGTHAGAKQRVLAVR